MGKLGKRNGILDRYAIFPSKLVTIQINGFLERDAIFPSKSVTIQITGKWNWQQACGNREDLRVR